ncbi:MAG: helix-turn-helix domain-containing protein [Alphaproteobacteria bacterium]|nr:helix-turn-helix domain-containing protein [Alphaproteobacteria bacterium]
MLWAKGLKKSAIARILGVHRSTVRHFIDRLQMQHS